MYIVYFENSNGDKRQIGAAAQKNEANKFIVDFLDEKNYKSHYWRRWNVSDNIERIDVGSHTEFFEIHKVMEKPEFYKDSLFETLMENDKVITALREIDDKLKYAISTGLTHINYTNNNTNLMDKIMFVLEYMGFNVNDKYMHDENLSYIIIYL